MSSTIVCRNLVSCFENQITETTTLKLKVAAAPPPALDDDPPAEVKRTIEFGNWGFLQTVPKESGIKESNYYTNPWAKKSSFSTLTPKSLELCTENLGSETGTDTITDSSTIFTSYPSTENLTSIELDDSKQNETNSPKSPNHKEANSSRKTRNFPPPLTTMSGSSSLQVRRHREGGRLIIEAVEAPFVNSYLQADRSDGRLKLCFLTGSDAADVTTSGGEDQEEEEENGDECSGEIEELGFEKEEFEGEINLEMGIEKFQRLSRCKEGGHGNKRMCSNWKPALWVASS